MTRVLAATGLSIALASGSARAQPSVVVFPFEARGAPSAAAQKATRAAISSLADDPSVRVLGPSEVEARVGVDLREQARGCRYDVFCLVELGRVLDGERVLVGHVDSIPGSPQWSLHLLELDVTRAAMIDTSIYRISSLVDEELEAAASVGARRLLVPPDTDLEISVDPPEATVTFLGDPVVVPRGGRLRWWSGRWRLAASAPGYESRAVWIDVHNRGSPTSVHLRLRPDPLHAGSALRERVDPFDRPSRSTGSGVRVEEAGEVRVRRASYAERFARPLPWVVSGVGAVAVGGGLGLMLHAQSQYAELAAEPRYQPGLSSPADLAQVDRDALRDQHLAGSLIAVAGGVVLAAGLAWLLFFPGDETRRSRQTKVSPESGVDEVARARAATWLAKTFTPTEVLP